tara:strand:- start:177 stop:746 length:570 start_codon:yes stop_codon:yes gene_type:complete
MANERARGLGYKYITDDKYLVDPFSPTEGISYEGDGSPVSYANATGNTGIMTQSSDQPLQYINRDGRGGAENEDGNKNTTNADLTGWNAVKQAGLFFTNPIAFAAQKLFKAYQEKRDIKETKQNIAEYGTTGGVKSNRPNTGMNAPGSGKGRSPTGGDVAGTPFADGGRTGYFFGGRAKFKNGGLAGIL